MAKYKRRRKPELLKGEMRGAAMVKSFRSVRSHFLARLEALDDELVARAALYPSGKGLLSLRHQKATEKS